MRWDDGCRSRRPERQAYRRYKMCWNFEFRRAFAAMGVNPCTYTNKNLVRPSSIFTGKISVLLGVFSLNFDFFYRPKSKTTSSNLFSLLDVMSSECPASWRNWNQNLVEIRHTPKPHHFARPSFRQPRLSMKRQIAPMLLPSSRHRALYVSDHM